MKDSGMTDDKPHGMPDESGPNYPENGDGKDRARAPGKAVLLLRPVRALRNFLQRRGVEAPELLFVLTTQIIIAALGLAGGLLFLWKSSWLFFFGLGAALGAYNFWGLTRFGIRVMAEQAGFSGSLLARQMFSFFSRFFITAAVLLFFSASIIPLLIGLGTLILVIMCLGLVRLASSGV